METKHTPGPWEAFESRGIGHNRAIGATPVAVNVCDVAYCDIGNARSDAEKHANARIIAAAPELLEAVKVCRVEAESLRRQYVSEDAGEEWIERQSYIVGLCDAAIAKATGKTA